MSSLNIEKVARALEAFKYADARILQTRTTLISVKDGVVESLSENSGEGASARVFANGAFGFACSNKASELPWAVERASKLSRIRQGKITLPEPEVHKRRVRIKPRKNPVDYSIEEKIATLLEFEKEMRLKKIHSTHLVYRDQLTKRIFLNSAGSEIIQQEPRTACIAIAYAKSAGEIQSHAKAEMKRSGLDALRGFAAQAREASEVAVKLLAAKKAPAGIATVVLDPRMAGILAHEAVGHASEADYIATGNSCFAGKLGEEVAGEGVTVKDSPVRMRELWGSYAYDDEGTRAKENKVIDRGFLAGYLSSLDTAEFNCGLRTGNARVDWLNTPLVRMSTTFFERGDASKDEIFETRRGVYVVDTRGGQTTGRTGCFMFYAGYGYLIERGEQKGMVRDFAIHGNIREALKSISLVGKDLEFKPGMCGKEGQAVPVCDGAPHLRIESILVA